MGTSMTRMTFFSSGEKRKPARSLSVCEICRRSVPSAFMTQSWLLPDALLRKAILRPPSMKAALRSLFFPSVRQREAPVARSRVWRRVQLLFCFTL